jgi:hypothetical protein
VAANAPGSGSVIKEGQMNCWEVKKCGREQGGARVEELGVCPAWPDHGRHCARVTGTLCAGRVQGEFSAKLDNCQKCEVYRHPDYDHGWLG